MTGNPFEDSRVAAATLELGSQKPVSEAEVNREESNSISRDDRRDGQEEFAEPEHRIEGRVLSASTLTGDRVRNVAGEDLGKVEEIMLDIPTGRVAYAVVSFGGFLGIGDKLFAVPWNALRLNKGEHEFILDVDRNVLESAPGFDRHNWPDMADPAFGEEVHSHYGGTRWDHTVTDAGDYTGENSNANKSSEYEPTIGYQAGGKR